MPPTPGAETGLPLPITSFTSTINEVKKLRIGINDFEVKDVIGRGHFGEVQVVREKASGDVYAMKVLHKDGTLSKENVSIIYIFLILFYFL